MWDNLRDVLDAGLSSLVTALSTLQDIFITDTTLDWAIQIQLLFIGYFILLSLSYLLLNISSFLSIRGYMKNYASPTLPKSFGPLLPPVSVVVPAYNEELNIVSSIKSLLQLDYPRLEIIVIDDGSKDNTTQVIFDAFAMYGAPETVKRQIETRPVEAIYRSAKHSNLRLVRKQNGGKADALNVGINMSRFPLFCAVDADSILQRDSLDKLIKVFVDNPKTVAAGGSVRVANGSEVHKGLLVRPIISNNFLARLQTIEYIRAFLFGRMGWSPLNGVLIISGAFGVFRKNAVVECGGYNPNTVGEDMELILRLHRLCQQKQQPYHIDFVPDPVCWTEAPEDLKTLRNQRIRWQRGLWESLTSNIKIALTNKPNVAGWLTFPFMLIFEAIGPIIELIAYIVTAIFYLSGAIDANLMAAFIIVAFVFGIFISTLSLLLEELSFHVYRSRLTVFRLLLCAIVENIGYRQMNSWWRMIGTWRWLRGQKHNWGEMRRTGKWKS